jgi:hypothetical protein
VTVTNFSAFVDQLAKNPGKKKMEPVDYFFLARCYDSLGEHEKAADMYKSIPEPASIAKKDKLDENEEKEIQTYWYAQIEYARQLRLIKDEKDKREANLSAAYKILSRVKSHPNGRDPLRAEKELIQVVEDSERYGPAVTEWNKFMIGLQRSRNKDDARVKEMYFDAYYHLVFSTYKYSQTEKAKATGKEKSYLRKAADYILRLERIKDANGQPGEGWQAVGPQLVELMNAEPPLRDMYEELKKNAK